MPVMLFAYVKNIGLELYSQRGLASQSFRAQPTTTPAARSTKHELLSVRNKCALLYAAPRVQLLLRCGATTPESGRT